MENDTPIPWITISTEVLGTYPIFELSRSVQRSPLSGREHRFLRLECSDWVNVVALTGDGRMILVKQYRHGTDEMTIEIPGGAAPPQAGLETNEPEGAAALDELSLNDREIFKDALRTSMVKRGDEIATYDQLFDLFWSGFYDNLRESFGDMQGQLGDMSIDLEELMRQITEMLGQMDGEDMDLSELAKALLTPTCG